MRKKKIAIQAENVLGKTLQMVGDAFAKMSAGIWF